MSTITRLKARWVSIPVNWLKNAAPALLSVAKAKTHPSLSSIHVSYFNGQTRLVATDLDQYLVVVHRDPKVEDDAERIMAASSWVLRNFQGALLPLSVLRMVLKDAQMGTPVRIDWTGDKGEVQWVAKGIAMRQEFDALDADDFPMPVEADPDDHRFYWAEEEHARLATVAHAMSDDVTRYVLNGAFLDADGSWTATDGRRLATVPSLSAGINVLPMRSFILPAVSLIFRPPWAKIATSGIASVGDTRLRLDLDNDTIYVCKTIEGNYPNYKQVIPRHTPAVWLDFGGVADACIAAFKTFGTQSKKPHADSVHIHVDGSSVKFGSATVKATSLPVKVTGQNAKQFKVCFNIQFLCEALASGFTSIGLTDDVTPAIGKHPDGGTYVVMPMRVN